MRLIEEENIDSISVERDFESAEPLIIVYKNGEFKADCQRELFAGLKARKINAYPALLMVQKEEYKTFERQFGRYFVVVN